MTISVLKFGGTSVKDAFSMLQAAEIVMKENNNVVVVLSAASGVTNDLLLAAQLAADEATEKCNTLLTNIKHRHLCICDEILPLDAAAQCKSEIDKLCAQLYEYCEGIALLRECTPRSLDAAAVYGELLSTTIFASLLNSLNKPSVFYDARTFMRTDSSFTKANPDFTTINALVCENLTPEIKKGNTIITQGFIGSDATGATTTLGRGGSDFSAAIIGAALGAEEIQIWTDVSGIYSADPRHAPLARPISTITYEEARQLAFFGAKVLHPETILPAIKKNIAVRVLNTFAPKEKGTIIIPAMCSETPHIRAVSVKTNCALISDNAAANAYDNFENFQADFISRIADSGLSILVYSGSESNAFAVVEADSITFAMASISLKLPLSLVEECAVLCACGPEISSAGIQQSKLASDFSRLAIMHGAKSVLTASAGPSAYLAVLPRYRYNDALIAVHDLCAEHSILPNT